MGINHDMHNSDGIVYCATAIIDLLGFSSHLEVGSNDVRTTIGSEALDRLMHLDDVMTYMKNESVEYPDMYPESFSYRRINDALILCVDLKPFLLPDTGKVVREGYSAKELSDYILEGRETESIEARDREYQEVLRRVLEDQKAVVQDLILFVGIVSRVHSAVNELEMKTCYPGARTTVSTGLRRKYDSKMASDDILSANFSFSNAYIADTMLHGRNLYFEDSISKLISVNQYARNAIRYASFVNTEAPFDPTEDPEDGFYYSRKLELTKVKQVDLFRKEYYFRKLNPAPLTALHFLIAAESKFTDISTLDNVHLRMTVGRLATTPDVDDMRRGALSRPMPIAIPMHHMSNAWVRAIRSVFDEHK